MNNKLAIKTGTWSLVRYRPWHFFLSVATAVYAFSMRLVPGWLEKSYFDQLTSTGSVTVATSSITLPNTLWTFLLLIVGVEISRMVFDVSGNWSAGKVRQAGGALMRSNIMHNIDKPCSGLLVEVRPSCTLSTSRTYPQQGPVNS